MKRALENLLILICLGLLPLPLVAQAFTPLYTFSIPYEGGTNNDGDNPAAGMILSSNILYGTTELGGSSGNGTVFKLNPDGTGYTNLYSFTAGLGEFANSLPITNSDGARPRAELILSSNILYGTASQGGSFSDGAVFAISIDGLGFTNLHSFTVRSGSSSTNRDGAKPEAGLILSGITLYGTASSGGKSGSGTVFRLNTDGTHFTNLYSFKARSGPASTNSDGAGPGSKLTLSGKTLYGTANGGGRSGYGTVFRLDTDGTHFTNLYSFTGGNDGGNPAAGLLLSGSTLYGTAVVGGSGSGTVFRLDTNGKNFTNLYSFSNGSDGTNPGAGLVLLGRNLYGTAYGGGTWGNGSVFAVNTNGSSFTTLYSFTPYSGMGLQNNDGANPEAELILSGSILYGTAYEGGGGYHGTIFSLGLPQPQLTINYSGTNVILTWPTNSTDFILESTTNLVSTVIWKSVSTMPAVVYTNNAVTNGVTNAQIFYRLRQ